MCLCLLRTCWDVGLPGVARQETPCSPDQARLEREMRSRITDSPHPAGWITERPIHGHDLHLPSCLEEYLSRADLITLR